MNILGSRVTTKCNKLITNSLDLIIKIQLKLN